MRTGMHVHINGIGQECKDVLVHCGIYHLNRPLVRLVVIGRGFQLHDEGWPWPEPNQSMNQLTKQPLTRC